MICDKDCFNCIYEDCIRSTSYSTSAEYRKAYYQKHKEEKREYNRKYRELHKEELYEYHKAYKEAHKEKFKEYRHRNYMRSKSKEQEA